MGELFLSPRLLPNAETTLASRKSALLAALELATRTATATLVAKPALSDLLPTIGPSSDSTSPRLAAPVPRRTSTTTLSVPSSPERPELALPSRAGTGSTDGETAMVASATLGLDAG